MNFGIWTNNGALNSKLIFNAFKIGARKLGHNVFENKITDIEVIWSILWQGRMLKNKEIWDRCKKQNKPIIVLEVGGIYRNKTWKVGINGINNTAYFGPTGNNSSRARQLNLSLSPWKKNNEGKIMIACQHKMSGQWNNQFEMENWLDQTIKDIRQHSNKEIIIRPHPRCSINIEKYKEFSIDKPIKILNSYDDFNFNVTDLYALFNYSSNPGIIAAISGIPTFCSPASLAYAVSNKNCSTLSNPLTPDRTQWLNDLAYTEWTIEEIYNGEPIKRLTSYLEEYTIGY